MWEAVVVPPRPENVTCTSIVCASVLMMTVACPVPGEPVGRNFARPEHDGAVSNDTSVCCLPQNESGNHRHVQVFHCLLLFPVPGTKSYVSGRGRWHRLNYKCWEHTMSIGVCQPVLIHTPDVTGVVVAGRLTPAKPAPRIGDIVLAGRYATKNHLKRFRSAAVDGTDSDLQQGPEYSTRPAAAASRAIIRAEAGAGERCSVCSVAHPARRRGGAALSARIAVAESGAGPRGRAIQHEPGGAGTHQQHRQHTQPLDRSTHGGSRDQHRRGGDPGGGRRPQYAERRLGERRFHPLLL